MRSDAPPLLPVLRSQHQADLLTLLLLRPEAEFTISGLAKRLSLPRTTVSGEVARLADAEILATRTVGGSRLVRANEKSRLCGALTELITLTYGPHVVVAQEFAALGDVQLVVIYGSWAARYQGERGRPPRDIDVLVVGEPDRIALYDAAERAEKRLSLPVNPTVCSQEQWRDPDRAFLREVRARPYLVVVQHEPDPGRPA